MFPIQIPKIDPDEFSRCEEQRQTDHEKSSPYPCDSEDVFIPVECQAVEIQIAYEPQPIPFAVLAADVSLEGQVIANDSLGG